MQNTIIDYIDNLQIKEPTVSDRISVFPLCGEFENGLDCLLLDEALEQGMVEVTEIGDAGSVPTLKLLNRSERRVLILNGEELMGAKQNRVVNTTILVDRNKKIDIPVSCVEAHRWSESFGKFTAGKKTMPANLRGNMNRAVKKTLVTMGAFTGEQRQVWVDIDEMMGDMKVGSQTAAMSDIFAEKEKSLDDLIKNFSPDDKQVGFLVALDGRIIGCDCFGSQRILHKLFDKLLRSYAIEALSPQQEKEAVKPSAQRAAAFVKTVHSAQVDVNDSVDLGKDVRLENKEMIGSALVFNGNVMHLALFAAQKQSPPSRLSALSSFGFRSRQRR